MISERSIKKIYRFFIYQVTRLSNFIFSFFSISVSSSYWQKTFYMLSALLIGFLSGALFGTVLPFIRSLFFWDGLIIFSLLIFIEYLSYISYRPHLFIFDKNENGKNHNRFFNQGTFLQRFTQPGFLQNRAKKDIIKSYNENSSIVKGLSFFKIGLMIGFFVDAFKVGS